MFRAFGNQKPEALIKCEKLIWKAILKVATRELNAESAVRNIVADINWAELDSLPQDAVNWFSTTSGKIRTFKRYPVANTFLAKHGIWATPNVTTLQIRDSEDVPEGWPLVLSEPPKRKLVEQETHDDTRPLKRARDGEGPADQGSVNSNEAGVSGATITSDFTIGDASAVGDSNAMNRTQEQQGQLAIIEQTGTEAMNTDDDADDSQTGAAEPARRNSTNVNTTIDSRSHKQKQGNVPNILVIEKRYPVRNIPVKPVAQDVSPAPAHKARKVAKAKISIEPKRKPTTEDGDTIVQPIDLTVSLILGCPQ